MKKMLSIVLATIMLVSLAACGNGDSTAGGSSGSAAPATSANNAASATSAKASDPLVIVYCGYSLSQESGARAKQVLTIATDKLNAAGGVNGQKVQVEFIDGGSDQQSYIDAYLKAIEVDGAGAVIGTFYSQYALACADYANDAKIPTFNVATNYEMAQKCKYYYTNRCVDTAFSNTMAQIAIDNGVKHPVTLFYNTSNGYNDSAFMKKYLESKGLSVASEIAFDNTSTTDYTSIVLQAMHAADSDGILLHATANTDGQSIIKLLHQYNYKYPVISNSNIFNESFVKNVGAASVAGVMGFAEYATTVDRSQIGDFTTLLKDGKFTYDTTSWVDASYYDDFCLIAEAAKLAGGNNASSVDEGLKQIKGYKGVMTDYTYHSDNSFADTIYLAKFDKDGKIVISDAVPVTH